jgi:hypothetical protein
LTRKLMMAASAMDSPSCGMMMGICMKLKFES